MNTTFIEPETDAPGIAAGPAGVFVRPRHILAPVDFSAAARRSFEYASALTECFDAELTLLHVVEPPALPDWGYAHLVCRDEVLKAAAHEKLASFAFSRPGLSRRLMNIAVRAGEPELQITAAARELDADLIVIATHGHSTLPHCLLGNTAEQVVRRAPCPVWTVHGEADDDGRSPALLPLRHMLVATDFSTESRKAIRYGVALAREFDSTLHVVHVVPTVLPADVRQLTTQLQEKALKRSAQREIARLCADEIPAGLRVESGVLEGNPFLEINKEALRVCAGLIVVSTHGHSGLRYLLLGCTAQRIVQHACVPVLVVRECGTEFIPLIKAGKESLP